MAPYPCRWLNRLTAIGIDSPVDAAVVRRHIRGSLVMMSVDTSAERGAECFELVGRVLESRIRFDHDANPSAKIVRDALA